MNSEQAHTAILTAALVTVAAWGYRKLVEPVTTAAKAGEAAGSTLTAFFGAGQVPANSAQFAVGFGFAFISLAVISTFAPGVAGGLAVTEAVGVVLVNGAAVAKDVTGQVTETTTTETAKKPAKAKKK